MYKILVEDRRYGKKTFASYEEARKYLRRVITRLTGAYRDDYTGLGFRIVRG